VSLQGRRRWPRGSLLAELRALQERFFALITAREDVAGALQRLGWGPGAAAAMATGDHRLDAIGRIGIYNDMYFMRLRGVLAEDFTAVLAVLGEDDFRALVADYLEAFPPRDPCLRNFASALPGFMAGQAVDNSWVAGRPWLADLAALEWARADQFDRPDAAVMTLSDLQALAPEQFADLPLRAVPASAIVDVAFAVDRVWRATEEADAARSEGEPLAVAAPDVEAVRIVVWRHDLAVYHRRATADESVLLPALMTGTTFGAICEHLGQDRSPEAAAQVAFGLLTTWMQDGLLCKAAPAAGV
jgi:hypothetical protein